MNCWRRLLCRVGVHDFVFYKPHWLGSLVARKECTRCRVYKNLEINRSTGWAQWGPTQKPKVKK